MKIGEQGDGTRAISVALVDGQPLFRAGTAHAICSQPEFEVVDQGETGDCAVNIAGKGLVDILVIDYHVKGGGLLLLARLANSWPNIKVVVLTTSEDEDDVSSALRCGVRGYLLRNVGVDELMTTLRSVARGDVYLSPSLGARLLARMSNGSRPAPQTPGIRDLTPREMQILTQVSLGATNKEIAIKLTISEKTVKYYMTNIMQKLQVRNRVEAVLLLRENTPLSA